MRALVLLLVLSSPLARAGVHSAHFTENRGQWPEDVLYRARVPGGMMFVERAAFTFVLATGGPLAHHHEGGSAAQQPLLAHAYRVEFIGGRALRAEGTAGTGHYENFFTGADPAGWAVRCGVFGGVLLEDVWPGIDIRIDGGMGIKYDIIVHPGADPGAVGLRYTGVDKLHLEGGDLVTTLSNGRVRESIPLAYALDEEGARRHVPAAFRVDGRTVHFAVPAIDPDSKLVIDPTIAFSSYSGSSGDNFGYTATYDNGGHLYGGGIVFDPGYPTTVGVLQDTFLDGGIDIGLSKWTPDGGALVWSTYLGGTRAETPHSLVVNDAGELYVMGATASTDFPVTPGAYDTSFNGGTSISNVSGGWVGAAFGYGFNMAGGSDLFVARLGADATSLLGSTYVGGSANDGLNNAEMLAHNYGDHFRGEIALDASGRPVVATSTASADAPVSANAPQPAFGGGLDAYFFRLDAGLSILDWATFHGGGERDNGLGVQFDSGGRMFFTGGTRSADLPVTAGAAVTAFQGMVDGYVARYSASGNALLSSSFIGTTAFDQTYLVQLDQADNVHVLGQTEGNQPITAGRYGNVGGDLFLHKYTNDLSARLWGTRLGNSQGSKLSPTAFLVSDCDQIYLSAWGGGVLGEPIGGLPITPDAFQGSTNSGDFYLMVLEPDATGLNYGSYFGGAQSSEHVDGGTSRFDKNGTIYQAVCAGCGSNDDFPTTPGAWSNTNGSPNCNLGVFKFSLGQPIANIAIDGPNQVCPGEPTQFINFSFGGTGFAWDFGDGSAVSADEEPVHVFGEPGTFTVTMVLSDPGNTCFTTDTASLTVSVLPPVQAAIAPVDERCPGEPVQLQASGGGDYVWLTTNGLSSAVVADPTLVSDTAGVWVVVVSDVCSSDTAAVAVNYIVPQVSTSGDTFVCIGDSTIIEAFGGTAYSWSPPATLSDAMAADPWAEPQTTTLYTVAITTPEGCQVVDSLLVQVLDALPVPTLQDTVICRGDTIQRATGIAAQYVWDAAQGISALDVQAPLFHPDTTTRYSVSMITPCAFVRDSVLIAVQEVNALAWGDTLVCPGEPVPLRAVGGAFYRWSPEAGLTDATSPEPIARPAVTTEYVVRVQDGIGCSDLDTVLVELRPWPFVQAGPGGTIDFGDGFILTASGNGVLSWNDIGQAELQDPAAQLVEPEETTTYVVTVIDSAGCRNTSSLTVIVNGDLYVPNSFTPNGDGYNDGFGASGKDIATITLEVFDRWGLLVWSTNTLDDRWDGTCKGRDAPVDTYVWKLSATEFSGRQREAIGHVTLVR
jgi:gliding motility-associated-like protein